MTKVDRNLHRQLMLLLKELHLPMFREYYGSLANQALQQDMSYTSQGGKTLIHLHEHTGKNNCR